MRWIVMVAGACVALLMTRPALAQSEPDIRDELPASPAQCAVDGVAVGGYDLVSYRQEGGPQFGSPTWSSNHDGLTYLFVSETNRDQFVAEPNAYLPEYSGWCAVTLALGRLTCPDYSNFKIEDGKLLLFELTGFTNGRHLWNSSPAHYKSLANDNYAVVMASE